MQCYPKTIEYNDHAFVLRQLTGKDSERLAAFFRRLAENEAARLPDDLPDPDLIRGWTPDNDLGQAISLVAEDNDEIVAHGVLYTIGPERMRLTGCIRLTVARTHREVGLDRRLLEGLAHFAQERGLEMLQVVLSGNDYAQVENYRAIGFRAVGDLGDSVEDREGGRNDRIIMAYDVRDGAQALIA